MHLNRIDLIMFMTKKTLFSIVSAFIVVWQICVPSAHAAAPSEDHEPWSRITVNKPVIAHNGDVQLFSESFGDSKHPPVLLIMGLGSQGFLWDDAFCQGLVRENLFVVRYDHRDTGESTRVDNAYTVSDMAKDAVSVLESYKIPKAHIVGLSLGGQIAQFMGADFPDVVSSLTLISTTLSFEPFLNAVLEKPAEIVLADGSTLSRPNPAYIEWAKRAIKPDQTRKELEADFVKRWWWFNGREIAFNEAFYQKKAKFAFDNPNMRNTCPNHTKAIMASCEAHKQVLSKIKAPTSIFHGTGDTLFPPDHASALAKAIQGSKLEILDKMGHNLHPYFYDKIIQSIMAQVKSHQS